MVLVQEMSLKADMEFINALVEMFSSDEAPTYGVSDDFSFPALC